MNLTDLDKLEYREQVLNLHLLSEEEQRCWLVKNQILHESQCSEGCYETVSCECGEERLNESLADCAFRLRDECFDVGLRRRWLNCLSDLRVNPHQAKPIRWIQANLIAKIGE